MLPPPPPPPPTPLSNLICDFPNTIFNGCFKISSKFLKSSCNNDLPWNFRQAIYIPITKVSLFLSPLELSSSIQCLEVTVLCIIVLNCFNLHSNKTFQSFRFNIVSWTNILTSNGVHSWLGYHNKNHDTHLFCVSNCKVWLSKMNVLTC
jgi:hypothetical protein